MKYFKVTMDSVYMCGFESHGYFIGESEEKIQEDILFQEFYDEMIDYVLGHVDDDDLEENENFDEISIKIEEITKEEYLKGIEYYGEETPWSCG